MEACLVQTLPTHTHPGVPAPAGGWDALVSMQITSSTRNDLFAQAALSEGQIANPANGVSLQVQALPYELLADI